MQIIDYTTFLTMPGNTLFAKYEAHFFDQLSIKGASFSNDFFYVSIADAVGCGSSTDFYNILETAATHRLRVPMDFDIESRDGIFDEDQLFVVYEKEDLVQLVAKLNGCIEAINE